jgi:ferritin-like metal-binding protein YciE
MDQTLYSLLIQEARFLFGAETEQAERLGELAEAVTDEQLRTVFTEHAEETASQIQRLQTILVEAGEEAEGDLPGAVEGLVDDAAFVAEQDLGPVRDIAIAGAARKMEHYEIGCYESAIAIAEQLGLAHIVEPLRQSLEEERRADSRIAEASLRLIQAQVPQETERV